MGFSWIISKQTIQTILLGTVIFNSGCSGRAVGEDSEDQSKSHRLQTFCEGITVDLQHRQYCVTNSAVHTIMLDVAVQ